LVVLLFDCSVIWLFCCLVVLLFSYSVVLLPPRAPALPASSPCSRGPCGHTSHSSTIGRHALIVDDDDEEEEEEEEEEEKEY
jgi:hypothetical protein